MPLVPRHPLDPHETPITCTDQRCHDGRGHTYEAGCELGDVPLRDLFPEPRRGLLDYLVDHPLVDAIGGLIVALFVAYLLYHLGLAATRG